MTTPAAIKKQEKESFFQAAAWRWRASYAAITRICFGAEGSLSSALKRRAQEKQRRASLESLIVSFQARVCEGEISSYSAIRHAAEEAYALAHAEPTQEES